LTPPADSGAWPTCELPPLPPARGFEAEATAEVRPRYEDISQDGRIHLTSLMPGLGAVWRMVGASGVFARFREQGILPVLHRLVIAGEKGPFSVGSAIEITGTWRLARETNGDRIFLDMWIEARAPNGFTLAAPPPADAPRVLVGRLYAGHVITKPFAPPAERKVARLDLPGLPAVPEDDHPYADASELVAGHPLEPATQIAFAMMHTDSNQHVNSLVYPRLFEEALLQRLIARQLGPSPHMLMMRGLEVRWRKPFFAGERATIALHADRSDKAVAVGTFSPEGAPADAKPSCALAAWLG
jgi:hypothetical protein